MNTAPLTLGQQEEAANIATEFISSLDNVPQEVGHVLAEIRWREEKMAEIQSEIHKESGRYIKYVIKSKDGGVAPPATSAPAEGAVPATPTSTAASAMANKINNDYALLHTLQDEKIALAEKLVQDMERMNARLEFDIGRVVELSGGGPESVQVIEEVKGGYVVGSVVVPRGEEKEVIRESVREKEKVKKMPVVVVPPERGSSEEADETDGGDGEDQALYCFCQKLSYGEMIACDNGTCVYQWFHLGCVGLKPPLPDRWFCEECLAAGHGGRKGRRKN